MKNYLLLLSLLSLSQFVWAQETISDQFIEVTVRDTIEVTPNFIEAVVTIENMQGMALEDAQLLDQVSRIQEEEKVNQAETKLKELFKKYKLKHTVYDHKQRDVYGRTGLGNMYQVQFITADSYFMFSREIAGLDNVSLFIQSKKSENMEQAENILAERLLTKARKRAEHISKVSQVVLGPLLQVKEFASTHFLPEGNTESAYTLYPALSMLPVQVSSPRAVNIVIEKSVVVRFRIK